MSRFTRYLCLASCTGAVLASAPAAAQTTICAPGLTFTDPPNVTPTLPVVSGDINWTGAAKFVVGNGTTMPLGAVQVIQDATNHVLYLSFEVHGDNNADSNDTVAVALDVTSPQTDPGNGNQPFHDYHLFVLSPLGTLNPANTVGVYTAVSEYHHVHTSQLDPVTAGGWGNPAGINTVGGAAVSSVLSETQVGGWAWYVALKVPYDSTGINLLNTSQPDYGLYVDVVSTQIGNTTPKIVWPPSANPITGLFATQTPAPSSWGRMRLGTSSACGTGIHFAGGWSGNPHPDLYVNTPANTTIALGNNTFFARVHNTTTSSYPDIMMSYKYGHFGITNSWSDVPDAPSHDAAGNGLWGPFTIGAGGPDNPIDPDNLGNATILNTASIPGSDWPGGINSYAGQHYCFAVELDVKPGSSTQVNFLNKSAIQNMDFSGGTKMKDKAIVEAKGFGLPPPGQANHTFYLSPTISARLTLGNTPAPGTALAVVVPRNEIFEQLTYLVNGFRATGEYVVVNGTKYEITEPVGFGYVLQKDLGVTYKGDVNRMAAAGARAEMLDAASLGVPAASLDHWQMSLDGAQRLAGGGYRVDVKQDEAVSLSISAQYVGNHIPPCGCHFPGTSMAMVALGLFLMRRHFGRREG
ncbi:MAG TPA: hypothetical protein VFG59_12160 [Anaeromyxobacter sp.]|nr:hypothetical protein [Anaeromyxobacter sp.]